MVSAAILFAISVMPGAVAPGIVGSAATSLQLSESQLGIFIGLYSAGFGITGASAYLWIREINWRIVSAVGVTLMGLTFILMGMVENYTTLLILMFINGTGSGLFGAPSITILGDGAKPENGFSAMIVFSVSGAALLLFLFPWADTKAGFTGVMCLMAITTLAALSLIPCIPVNNKKQSAPANKGSHNSLTGTAADRSNISQPLLVHFVMVLFVVGFIGMWTFFERIAHYAQLSPVTTGQTLAIGTLFGAIGAPVAAFMRHRIPMYYCYIITIICIVITLLLLDLATLTDLIYLALVCSFQFWINSGFCLIMALTAEVDKIGRFVALIPASESAGAFIGPIITGISLENWGVRVMITIIILVFILGACVFTFVDRKDLKNKK